MLALLAGKVGWWCGLLLQEANNQTLLLRLKVAEDSYNDEQRLKVTINRAEHIRDWAKEGQVRSGQGRERATQDSQEGRAGSPACPCRAGKGGEGACACKQWQWQAPYARTTCAAPFGAHPLAVAVCPSGSATE